MTGEPDFEQWAVDFCMHPQCRGGDGEPQACCGRLAARLRAAYRVGLAARTVGPAYCCYEDCTGDGEWRIRSQTFCAYHAADAALADLPARDRKTLVDSYDKHMQEVTEARVAAEAELGRIDGILSGQRALFDVKGRYAKIVALLRALRELERARDEALQHADALDRNWCAVHENAMKPLRAVLLGRPEGTVPEMCEEVRRLEKRVTELRALERERDEAVSERAAAVAAHKRDVLALAQQRNEANAILDSAREWWVIHGHELGGVAARILGSILEPVEDTAAPSPPGEPELKRRGISRDLLSAIRDSEESAPEKKEK
jgi:hypothetical protein